MIDECLLRWFGHVKKMERNKTAKIVYVRECGGSCSVIRLQKEELIP